MYANFAHVLYKIWEKIAKKLQYISLSGEIIISIFEMSTMAQNKKLSNEKFKKTFEK